jgi:ABC-2 type transport system permease protein
MNQIIFNEWKAFWRLGPFRWLIIFLLLILIAVGYFGGLDIKNRQVLIDQSKAEVRYQWENMGPSNPHSAAHYGSYAFKPLTPLSALDEGVNLAAGSVLRLEGHVQNEMTHSSQSQTAFISYFGPLKASLILQIVLPLLIIFLTYYSIRAEYEQGRIRLLLVQGVSLSKLILGKVISIWVLALFILTITLIVQWFVFSENLNFDLLLRSFLIIIAYAGFYWIISSLTGFFSSRWFKGGSALTIMLAIWVVWLIFLPKISSWYVQKKHPLPSRQEFTTAMREDRSKGIDGHNPTDEREKALKDSVMLAYGVSELDSLPINYDGIRMQADEEYGNKVWDKHFGALYEIMLEQKSSIQLTGFINPFSSLQSLSMGICGTDQWSHLHFQKEAESYRRVFIKALNDEHAYGGSSNGDWGWKADQSFFNNIKDFQYQTPTYKHVFAYYLFDWIFLSIWVLLSSLVLLYGTKTNGGIV